MNIIGKALIPFFLTAGMLASCNSSQSTPTVSAAENIGTHISTVSTAIAETQRALPMATASPTQTPVTSSTATLTPRPSPTPYSGPNTLFFVQDDNRLFSINADGNNQQEIAEGIQFTVSPDQKKIVYRTAETYASNQDEMIVLDVEQKKIVFRWNIPGYCEGFFMSSRFAWSPDSQRIAFILVRHDLVDPSPSCVLEYNHEDMGIYQIDLTSASVTHPPINTVLDSLSASILLLYSPDGSKLRLDTHGQSFDTETWEPVASEPTYDLYQLEDQPEKIGICGDFNLCLYDHQNQMVKRITQHDQPWEGVETFKLFPNSSAVVYQTQEFELHLLSLRSESDEIIGTNVQDYFITPDNSRIVFGEWDRFVDDANIFVVHNDGSNKSSIAQFPQRLAAINGPLMALSPMGEDVAFVNRDGIAITNLDGNDFIQLVDLPDGAPAEKISLEILGWH